MALLQKLKSLFGVADGDAERGHDRDVGITVERERDGTERDDRGEAPAAEPATATGSTGDSGAGAAPPETAGPAEDEPTSGDAADRDDGSAESTEADDADPVDSIKGIGPAYAERLGEAGVETVDDLAAADADELEAETDISATRIRGWIERAEVR